MTRTVHVAPERLARWLTGFEQHGAVRVEVSPDALLLTGADGATARVEVPYGPWDRRPASTADAQAAYDALVAHARRERRIAVILLRRGGYAIAVSDGPRLLSSKVGTRHVQSRTAAGGWSQQRFARRRENQADELLDAVAGHAQALFAAEDPTGRTLDAVVGGGDRLLLDELHRHRLLAPWRERWVARRLDVPDPRRDVLDKSLQTVRAVRITLDP